jgi:hypothetical protein
MGCFDYGGIEVLAWWMVMDGVAIELMEVIAMLESRFKIILALIAGVTSKFYAR